MRAGLPVEAIFFEDDLPPDLKVFYPVNAEFFTNLGSPGGASRVGKTPRRSPVCGAVPTTAITRDNRADPAARCHATTGFAIRLVRPDRRDEAPRHGTIGWIRQWIESVNDTLKGHPAWNATAATRTRITQRLLATAATIWHH